MTSTLIGTVRAILAATPDRWDAVARLPDEALRARPAPDEWSALECLGHAVDTEAVVFAARVQALLDERDFAAFDPDAGGTPVTAATDPLELARRFRANRTESLRVLDRVRDGDLEKRARHAALGPVTLAELLHQWAGHDLMHVVQAERAAMQPFIRGSGPWRPLFSDHDPEADTRS
jgi:hypothetical protein